MTPVRLHEEQMNNTTADNICDLVITDIAYGGRGIGRICGKVVFVPGVLPGETVRVRPAREHSNYSDAELFEVLDPAPADLEGAFLSIVAELGGPAGPTRGVCTAIRQEWEMARIRARLHRQQHG